MIVLPAYVLIGWFDQRLIFVIMALFLAYTLMAVPLSRNDAGSRWALVGALAAFWIMTRSSIDAADLLVAAAALPLLRHAFGHSSPLPQRVWVTALAAVTLFPVVVTALFSHGIGAPPWLALAANLVSWIWAPLALLVVRLEGFRPDARGLIDRTAHGLEHVGSLIQKVGRRLHGGVRTRNPPATDTANADTAATPAESAT